MKAKALASGVTTAEVLEAANAKSWAAWFNASEVNLGPKRQYLEGF